jgi:hypothetical protein
MTTLAFDAGQDWGKLGIEPGMGWTICLLIVVVSLPVIGFLAWLMWLDARDRRKLAAAGNNRCPACGYDLTGNVSGVCPECGGKVSPGAGVSGEAAHD